MKLARSFIALLQKDDASTDSRTSYRPAIVKDFETPDEKPNTKSAGILPVDLVLAAIRVAAAVAPHAGLLRDLHAGAPRVLLLETGDATLMSEIYTVASVCLLPGRTLLSPSLLDSKPRRAPEESCAVIFKIGGSDRRSTDIDRIAATALSLGSPIVAITPERRLLPDELLRASDASLTLPALDAASVSFMIETVAGRSPVRKVEETLARRIEISDFRIALRGKRSADEFLAQLESVVRSRLAVETNRPSLEELHGYGRAKTVGLEIAADLKSYARAELQWDAIDRGLLLAGPPGTGKTLFARALAHSAGVPLIAASLAGWQASRDGHLGHTLSAMRSSFAQAQRAVPSILFVDELDAFGDRAQFSSDHKSYSTQIVDGFLELLDGVEIREGVVVLGATNHVHAIDPAIRRAGRLDRTIEIQLPDIEALAQILRYHLRDRLAGADLRAVAAAAQGASGADIASWVRRAAGVARRREREVQLEDLMREVNDGQPAFDLELRTRIGVHEAGHAIAAIGFGVAELQDISIRRSGGLTSNTLRPTDFSRGEFVTLIAQALAGREAERMVYGEPRSGSGGGADSDLAVATRLATAIETTFGLGTLGPCWLGEPDEFIGSARFAVVAAPVRRTLEEAERRAACLLEKNRSAVMRLADALSDRSFLRVDEILAVVGHIQRAATDAPTSLLIPISEALMRDDDWRRELVRRHPRLFTEISGRELQVTATPSVGDGWRDVLERAMDRLESVLDDSSAGRIIIRDIKQKFGGLRVYFATKNLCGEHADRASDIVFLAECRAAGACEACGAKGRLWSGDGWVRTACNVHAVGRPLGADDPDACITTRTWVGDAVVTRTWRYDRETDRLIEIIPP